MHIHQDTKSARLIAVCKRTLSNSKILFGIYTRCQQPTIPAFFATGPGWVLKCISFWRSKMYLTLKNRSNNKFANYLWFSSFSCSRDFTSISLRCLSVIWIIQQKTVLYLFYFTSAWRSSVASVAHCRRRGVIEAWKVCWFGYFFPPPLKEEMKWKLSLLHLQDLLKVIKNVFYSFSISHFVLELFRFVWNANETTSDIKLCTDHLKLLENHAHF